MPLVRLKPLQGLLVLVPIPRDVAALDAHVGPAEVLHAAAVTSATASAAWCWSAAAIACG